MTDKYNPSTENGKKEYSLMEREIMPSKCNIVKFDSSVLKRISEMSIEEAERRYYGLINKLNNQN